MKRFYAGVIVFTCALIGLGIGCASRGDADDWSDRVQMKERTIEDIERERAQAEVEKEEAPAEEEQSTDAEVFALSPEEPYVTQGRLTVSMRKGVEPPQISFAQDGKVEVITLSEPPLYQEGVVLEQLYSVRRMDDQLVVTMHSDLPTEPLSVEEALERARAEQDARMGCQGVEQRSEALPNGTVLLEVQPAEPAEAEQEEGPVIAESETISITPVGCQIVIGRYTRRPVEL